MMILSDNEVVTAAWGKLLSGAESVAEDWIDEDGEFTEEDGERVFQMQFQLLRQLKSFDPGDL